jgi:hypothetical protein
VEPPRCRRMLPMSIALEARVRGKQGDQARRAGLSIQCPDAGPYGYDSGTASIPDMGDRAQPGPVRNVQLQLVAVKATRRAARGLSILGAYTFAKIDRSFERAADRAIAAADSTRAAGTSATGAAIPAGFRDSTSAIAWRSARFTSCHSDRARDC